MPGPRFADRVEAGRLLGEELRDRGIGGADGLVLGIPRGGVVTAAEVARVLGLPLDVALARKVGARGLRMILEDLMLDLMYYLPSHKKVREFLVTKEMVITQKINVAVLEKAG